MQDNLATYKFDGKSFKEMHLTRYCGVCASCEVIDSSIAGAVGIGGIGTEVVYLARKQA